EDCNGVADDEDSGVTGTIPSWYPDGDGDGYGNGTAVVACDQPPATAGLDGDCDDADLAYHPNAPETSCADPNDYNCDGITGFADTDADGYAACDDCNDNDAAINPGAI